MFCNVNNAMRMHLSLFGAILTSNKTLYLYQPLYAIKSHWTSRYYLLTNTFMLAILYAKSAVVYIYPFEMNRKVDKKIRTTAHIHINVERGLKVYRAFSFREKELWNIHSVPLSSLCSLQLCAMKFPFDRCILVHKSPSSSSARSPFLAQQPFARAPPLSAQSPLARFCGLRMM